MRIPGYARRILRRVRDATLRPLHARFNLIEQQADEIASTQTALLQANIHLVQTLTREFAAVHSSLVRVVTLGGNQAQATGRTLTSVDRTLTSMEASRRSLTSLDRALTSVEAVGPS